MWYRPNAMNLTAQPVPLSDLLHYVDVVLADSNELH